MLKMQGIQVDKSQNFSIVSRESLTICFNTASEATKKIRNVINKLIKEKKVILVVSLPDGASIDINMCNVPHDEQLEIIDRATAMIVSDKSEGRDDSY